MLPCIVIYFFLNNQPDALIITILFCYKTLHVSDIFSARHRDFSALHSALVSFMQISVDRFQAESGWNCSSILTLLGSGHQKPAWNLPLPNVQQKIPDDGQRRCPKHVEFYNNKIGIISASGWLFKKVSEAVCAFVIVIKLRYRFGFVFMRHSVWMSTWLPVILVGIFRYFP
jgi:hypothetical protein